MSGDYDEVEFDPMLGIDGLREMGETWAAELDPKDYKVSPLFGEVDKLPKTTLFVGTHEIFYPDVVKFYNKLKDNGVDVELNVGEEMTHVYAIYPIVSESKDAFKHIVEIILG
jgi:acetyl esterase/lipase